MDVSEKLKDSELKRFLSSSDKTEMAVIIEINVARPKVVFDRRGQGASPSRIETTVSKQAIEDQATEARIFLQDKLGLSVTWIAAARAFSAEVTSAQLAEIAASPLFSAVHTNRQLRR